MFLTNSVASAETHTETTKTRETKKTKSGKAADDKGADTGSAKLAADNTGINKRDRDDKELTADQQKNNKSDVELTAEIRRAVVDDKTLSTNAHNIKIIVADGQVTLKGPVASKQEKATVEKKAAEVLGKGKGKVTSEIQVAP